MEHWGNEDSITLYYYLGNTNQVSNRNLVCTKRTELFLIWFWLRNRNQVSGRNLVSQKGLGMQTGFCLKPGLYAK